MPASYNHMSLHIVFSTKKRYRFLTHDRREQMHKYLCGIIENIKGKSIIIGGTEDHVHILCIIPKELSLADFVRAIKANSSKWFRQKYLDKFSWQTGYGAFAVSKSVFPIVVEYIANQEEHHKKQDSLDEFRRLVKSHGLVYEEPRDEDD